MVCISVASVIVYRVIMSVDYCSDATPTDCLIVSTVISSVFNALSILILGKVYDKLAVILTNWGTWNGFYTFWVERVKSLNCLFLFICMICLILNGQKYVYIWIVTSSSRNQILNIQKAWEAGNSGTTNVSSVTIGSYSGLSFQNYLISNLEGMSFRFRRF